MLLSACGPPRRPSPCWSASCRVDGRRHHPRPRSRRRRGGPQDLSAPTGRPVPAGAGGPRRGLGRVGVLRRRVPRHLRLRRRRPSRPRRRLAHRQLGEGARRRRRRGLQRRPQLRRPRGLLQPRTSRARRDRAQHAGTTTEPPGATFPGAGRPDRTRTIAGGDRHDRPAPPRPAPARPSPPPSQHAHGRAPGHAGRGARHRRRAPSAAAADARTRLTFTVDDCEGCEIRLVNARGTLDADVVHVWQSRTRTVEDGDVTFRVATKRTWGLSVTVRAPWEGHTGYATTVAWRYAGEHVGDTVTLEEAVTKRRASACWEGVRRRAVTVPLVVEEVEVDGVHGAGARQHRLRAGHAELAAADARGVGRRPGSQDVNICR